MLPEVPRTELVSLQVMVNRHRHSGIQKQRRRPGSSSQRNRWGKKIQNWHGVWHVGWHGYGVDFWGTRKKCRQNLAVNASFQSKSVLFFVDIQARICVTKSKIHGRAPTLVPSACSFWDCDLSARTERPSESALRRRESVV